MVVSKGGGQKVVVTQTCMDLSWNDMKWIVNALQLQLPLNPGDDVILLGLPHLIDPSTASFLSSRGFKGKEDANKIFATGKKMREEEVRKKREEYAQNSGVVKLQHQYQWEKKVNVDVEVAAGSSRKVAAVKAARRLGATWIVLDREMKKDKQYFLDRLSCGISSMKSNNTIVVIRGPINEHVSYNEMIPSYSWEDLSLSKSPGDQGANSGEQSSYCCSSGPLLDSSRSLGSSSCFVEGKHPTSLVQDIERTVSTKQAIREKSLSRALKFSENDQSEVCKTLENPSRQQLHNIGGSVGIYNNQMEEFENPICSVCKNRRPKFACHKDFTYAELDEATKGFAKKNFLSEGGFGWVFKGKLKDGLKVAVKQHKPASLQGEKEFKSEVHVLSQARHQNLVMLLGSCTEGTHRLLVYEYVCNYSLEYHLSDNPQPLNWDQRMKIAMGAAKGLAYLHERNIIHRDMRPANILITHDYESLLGDFGLAKAQQEDSANSCGVVGTLGYLAPEYAESGNLSTKTDVYSYGVVLLQLITGLRTTDDIPGGKSLVGWAKPLLEKKNYPDLIDKRIVDSHDVHQLFWMVLVAEKCLKKDPDNRWMMQQNVLPLLDKKVLKKFTIVEKTCFKASDEDFVPHYSYKVVQNLNCIKDDNTNFIVDFS